MLEGGFCHAALDGAHLSGRIRLRPRQNRDHRHAKGSISSKEGIQAADDLRRKYTGPQSDAESIKRQVLAHRIRLAEDGLSDQEREKLRRQVIEKARAMAQGPRDELERERTQIINALAKKLTAIVDAYAKEKKYDTVIDISNPNGPVIYFKIRRHYRRD